MPGMSRHAVPVFAVLAGLVLAASPASAQEAGATAKRTTPRDTVRTFMQSAFKARKGDPEALADAVGCMDLSHYDKQQRAELGPEIVGELKELLDFLDPLSNLEDLPDTAQGDPVVLYQDPRGAGEVVLAHDGVELGWRFTARTLQSVPDMLTLLRDQRAAEVPAVAEPEVTEEEPAVEEAPKPKRRPIYARASDWIRAQLPDSFRQRGLILENWQWAGLALVIFLGVGLDRLMIALLTLLIVSSFKRRGMELDSKDTSSSLRPIGLLIMAAFWWLGLGWLGLPEEAMAVVAAAVQLIAVAAGIWAAYRMVDVIANAAEKKAAKTESKFDDLLVPLVRKSAKVFVTAFGLIAMAEALHVSVSSLLAGVGLGGLAFALAAQDTVKNFFGSLTVVLDRPFHVGDWVKVGDDVEGTVEEVGFRSTRIRTFYNSVVSLPNATLLTANVDNMGRRRYRRWSTKLGVTYDTPPDRIAAFCEGIRELVRRHPHTWKDFFQVRANGFGDSAIEILLYVFHNVPDWGAELEERERLLLDIMRLAEVLGVEFAFPTQTLHVAQVSPAVGGARPGEGAPTNLGRLAARELLGLDEAGRPKEPEVPPPPPSRPEPEAPAEQEPDEAAPEPESKRGSSGDMDAAAADMDADGG
jgi:MscS family membrane protein